MQSSLLCLLESQLDVIAIVTAVKYVATVVN